MTVGDLKRELEEHDDDMPVHFAYNYGDHWRTEVAPEVTSVDTDRVVYSSYHNVDKIDTSDDDDDDSNKVLVLR